MISRVQRLGGELFWISFGQFMIVLGGIFGLRLLTYKLSPAVYGNLAIGMTAVIVSQQIILGPLGQGFLRFFASARQEGKLNIYIKTIRFLIIRSTLFIIGVAVISIIGLLLIGQAQWISLISLAFLYSLVSGHNIVLNYIHNAARQRKIVALHQGIAKWLHFLVPVALVGLWGADSSIAMFGFLVASVIILSSQIMFFKKKIVSLVGTAAEKVSLDVLTKYAKQILAYAWPFSTWGLFVWAQFASSRWALLSFTNAKEVGLFSILYQFGYYPLVVVTGLGLQLATPVLYSRAGAGKDSARVTNTISLNDLLILGAIIITVILVWAAYIFHNLIFSFVVAPEYRVVSSLLPLLVLSGGLYGIGQVVNIRFYIKTETRMLIYPKIVSATLGVLLNYLGAYFYGLKGVVMAGIAFSFVYLVWIFIMCGFSKRYAKLEGSQ